MMNSNFSLIEKVCCPLCGALFRNARQVDSEEGIVICSHCRSEFPIKEGVLFAPAISHPAEKELRLLTDRHLFWQNLQQGTLEAEFKHIVQLVHQGSAQIFRTALSEATSDIIFTTGPAILVSGIGAAEIARWMAGKGARVVALDYNPAELLQARAVYLTGETTDSLQRSTFNVQPRFIVAFPWRLPFLNEQFDAVLHVLSTPCAVFWQKLITELLRVLRRRGKLILFWGRGGRSPLPRGNELSGGLIEPRTYCSPDNPGRLTMKLSLLWAGATKIRLQETKDKREERREEREGIEQALTITATKRKKAKRSSPYTRNKKQEARDKINKFARLPFLMAQWERGDYLRELRLLFRKCVPAKAVTSQIDFSKKLSFWNELGWRGCEEIGSELARYPLSHAFCFLKSEPAKKALKIYLFGIPRRVIKDYRLEVEVNGLPVELDKPIAPGWQTRTILLPPVAEKGVLEIYFRQQSLFRLIDNFAIFDYRSLGIGIKSIEVV